MAQHPLARARHEHLLRQIELHGSVSAAAAAAELHVSQVTIRRDIMELEAGGLLARVHGGAIGVAAPVVPQSARVNIGVVVPGSTGHFPVIVRGMEAASHALRARLILATSQYRHGLERQQVERLVDIGVAGLVLAPTLAGRSEDELAEWIGALPVPVVFLERRLRSVALAQYDSVRSDHARGAMLAVEHFVRLGHDRVALAIFARTPTAPLVIEGHAAARETLGLADAPIAMLPAGGDEDMADALGDALGAFLDACAASGTRAALVHTDVHAARLVELATDRGIRIPEDLAVIAYDDDTAALAMVPLTAVTAPRRDVGHEALRAIAERVTEDPGSRAAPRHLSMLPKLTVRESCGSR